METGAKIRVREIVLIVRERRPLILTLTLTLIFMLTGCSRGVSPDAAGPNASLTLPLYPALTWSIPREAVRTFSASGTVKNVPGFEITSLAQDDENFPFVYADSEYPDEDFWRFYLESKTIDDMGYTLIASEEKDDRSLIAFGDEAGHALVLSHIMQYDAVEDGEPLCPCIYAFTIFSDDPRVVMEK